MQPENPHLTPSFQECSPPSRPELNQTEPNVLPTNPAHKPERNTPLPNIQPGEQTGGEESTFEIELDDEDETDTEHPKTRQRPQGKKGREDRATTAEGRKFRLQLAGGPTGGPREEDHDGRINDLFDTCSELRPSDATLMSPRRGSSSMRRQT